VVKLPTSDISLMHCTVFRGETLAAALGNSFWASNKSELTNKPVVPLTSIVFTGTVERS